MRTRALVLAGLALAVIWHSGFAHAWDRGADETDHVAHVNLPAFASWATSHGFSIDELAPVQWTYLDEPQFPSRWEEREAAERDRRARRVPRDLTRAHIRREMRWLVAQSILVDCFGERTGHFRMRTQIRVELGLRVIAWVAIRSVIDGRRDAALERCFRGWARRAMIEEIRSANYRLRAPIRDTYEQPLDVSSGAEIETAYVADRGSHRNQLSAFASAFPNEPIRILLRVAAWNGEVYFRWDEMLVGPRHSSTTEELDRWHRLQSVLGGALREHGTRDHQFAIDLYRDGTMRIVQSE